MEQEGVDDGETFLGQYRHTLDAKGRLILPAAFRDELSEGLVMTVGQDHCLTVHPRHEWQRVVAGLRSLRATDRRERAFVRVMTSSAHAEQLDRQGRVTIPAHLRTYAGLDKDVTVVGADTRVELWDSAAWDAYSEQAMAEFANTEQPFDIGGVF
jgi:MraZ protein